MLLTVSSDINFYDFFSFINYILINIFFVLNYSQELRESDAKELDLLKMMRDEKWKQTYPFYVSFLFRFLTSEFFNFYLLFCFLNFMCFSSFFFVGVVVLLSLWFICCDIFIQPLSVCIL